MLPIRDGVGPSCVGLPAGQWANLLDFLCSRFPAIPAPEWTARMARGDVVDEHGRPAKPDQAYQPHTRLFYYRSLPAEPVIAAAATVLFEDDLLVVADKPHFLPVTPTGKYLQQTLLVRLRRQLGIDSLTPLHRIDRETAGLVLLAKQPATCGRYHTLFAQRAVRKSYQAIAPWHAALQFPLTRESVLVEGDNFMQMRELKGGADAGPADADTAASRLDSPRRAPAHTRIDLIETHGAWARYRLHPLSGNRHQLRVHMAALGLPILGDRIYPALQPEGQDDPANPLRLLAEHLAFRDPITGEERSFSSRLKLGLPD